jgi:hypothetical protein
MKSNAIESARMLVNAALNRMPQTLKMIRERKLSTNLIGCYSSLRNAHLAIGIYNFFAEQDRESFKQHMYVASRLALESPGQQSGSFSIGRELFYGILSDSPNVISQLALFETSESLKYRDKPSSGDFFVHMDRLLILGHDDQVRSKLITLERKKKRIDLQGAPIGKDFYSLILNGEKEELEKLITKHARIKSADPLIENFISYLATFEAKICWMRGIQVQIDSPFVPMDLMPVQPLPQYDDVYEFLKPGWKPRPYTTFEKIQLWFQPH